MSFGEIPYRIGQALQKQKESLIHKHFLPTSALLSSNEGILNNDLPVNELFTDSISIFGKKFNYFEDNINWHRDIFSGNSFPTIFSKNINIRNNPKVAAKIVWEINRMQFLPRIALNYRTTGKEFYISQFLRILSSWIDQNPYLRGINWNSNIEVNIRLINWFFCWQILDIKKLTSENEKVKSFVEAKWIPSIYQHCYYSYHNPSKFSSSNNHLISEYAGLFIASSLWKFKESEKWIRYSKKGLEKEIIRQHSLGINKEEAAEYIQFITDFLLISYVVGENSNNPFSKVYKKELYNILKYICNFLDIKANFPKYGDEDDGKCLVLDFNEEFNNFKSLLTSGAILFKDFFLKSKSNGFDMKNQLLFGESGKKTLDLVHDRVFSEGTTFYPKEGHFISRKKEEDKEVYLHFDSAPLGFLSIAAHGHADALSFLLHVDGQAIFVDPGTYTYHTEPEWRNYFIGTLAHNTIRINKLNQATIAGPTLWLQHYKCEVLNFQTSDQKDIIKAKHSGYEKYGITHTREVIFDKKSLKIAITDDISSKNQGDFLIELPFHLHPAIDTKALSSHSFELINKNSRNVYLQIDPKLKTKVIMGQIIPEIIGWYSKSFLQKEPCTTIIGSIHNSGNIQFETIISIN
jgi:hypothetical protein